MLTRTSTFLVIGLATACFHLVGCQKPIIKCPDTCLECREYFYRPWHYKTPCLSCKPGFFSTSINCSSSCRPECETCDGIDQCNKCNAGYWGQWCHLTCPQGCKLSECPPDCELTECPPGCKVPECDKHSSVCTAGCKAGVEIGSLNCPCDTDCPISCPGRKHGVNCDKDCAPNCVSCTQATGTCTRCDIGFHGNNCSIECGHCNKEDKRCAFSDGACIQGCHEAYVAPLCLKVKPITVDHDRDSVSTNTIIGACVGAGVALIIIILVIVFVVRIRRRRNRSI